MPVTLIIVTIKHYVLIRRDHFLAHVALDTMEMALHVQVRRTLM